MTDKRGEGLARHRARVAVDAWPRVLAAIAELVAEMGDGAFSPVLTFSEIAARSGVAPRDLGSVFKLSDKAREWLADNGASFDVVDRRKVLRLSSGHGLPEVTPAAAPAAVDAAAVELEAPAPGANTERRSWLPSLL
jgi:hypothetical protein